MVDTAVGGVTYTSYPLKEGGSAIRIHANQGIAKGVVEGTSAADLYVVERTPPHALISITPGQLQRNHIQRSQNNLLLSLQELEKLASTSLLIEKHLGGPQDIEWAFDYQGNLKILQSRPFRDHQPAYTPTLL